MADTTNGFPISCLDEVVERREQADEAAVASSTDPTGHARSASTTTLRGRGAVTDHRHGGAHELGGSVDHLAGRGDTRDLAGHRQLVGGTGDEGPFGTRGHRVSRRRRRGAGRRNQRSSPSSPHTAAGSRDPSGSECTTVVGIGSGSSRPTSSDPSRIALHGGIAALQHLQGRVERFGAVVQLDRAEIHLWVSAQQRRERGDRADRAHAGHDLHRAPGDRRNGDLPAGPGRGRRGAGPRPVRSERGVEGGRVEGGRVECGRERVEQVVVGPADDDPPM